MWKRKPLISAGRPRANAAAARLDGASASSLKWQEEKLTSPCLFTTPPSKGSMDSRAQDEADGPELVQSRAMKKLRKKKRAATCGGLWLKNIH